MEQKSWGAKVFWSSGAVKNYPTSKTVTVKSYIATQFIASTIRFATIMVHWFLLLLLQHCASVCDLVGVSEMIRHVKCYITFQTFFFICVGIKTLRKPGRFFCQQLYLVWGSVLFFVCLAAPMTSAYVYLLVNMK